MTAIENEELKIFEKLKTKIYTDASEASKAVANEIAATIKIRQLEGKPCILGFATGSTPKGVYEELVRMHKKENLSFKNVISFNLDEYYPIQPTALQSYVRFMNEYLFNHIDIPKENINIPSGTIAKEKVAEFCREYEKKIESFGGIDIQILGIGRTGHIGFNEPGSMLSSATRLITLDHLTRIDASSDFFSEDSVPRMAITMGVGTIMKAKKVILMAWGEGKAKIIKKAVEGPLTEMIPATFLQQHPQATVVLDDAASAELTRIKTPWTVGKCTWDKAICKKAVIWLCHKVDKPILKLTDRDYADHGMADLLTEAGPAYNTNIAVFNDLQHTITGWPGGKPNADDSHRPERANPAKKRVIIFSPHPDDDIISMGGTFIRLVDQGHDVHVAYQTSGNIAVHDDEAIRFADFVTDFNQKFGDKNQNSNEIYAKTLQFLKNKKPGQIDSDEVKTIKGLIRRGEAKATCRFVGIPDQNIHFLDMPFYETGQIKKNPIGKQDVDIVAQIIEQIKPHQIYAAGDLSDPHGTHRVCLAAIFQALNALKTKDYMKDCWVWLYRGAWQEWEIHDIDMAVPISPDELLRKRKGIFKHQSQKDAPLFPGTDPREFWQRAEDRNHATAKLYDDLGLAEYEAMEAFKRYYY
ncbi:MAG: glucosamine-6-phosphate deaminase [Cytophagales bacterium]|nr:glucosamine-6-phosphate deaminase [Cytophagales bacterium]